MNRLPAGYRWIETLDFVRNRKQLRIVMALSLGLIAIMLALGLILRPISVSWRFMTGHLWTFPLWLAMQLAYIPLHEIVHGACMRLFSREKVRYGVQLCYAYAGSDAYFSVLQHNLIALAPLIFWGIALVILERALPEGWFWTLFSVQIANVSGSAGDLYCVFRTLRYPRGARIQDTGVRMRVFAPRPKEEKK